MHLLFLTPQLPYPPRQGTTIRNFNLLRHLAQRCTIDLLTFLAPGEQLGAGSPLHALCRRVAAVPQPTRATTRRALDTFTTLTPDMGLRLESALMHELVHEWTTQTAYDVVQVEGIELAQYGLEAAGRKAGKRAGLVFDNHNCEYLLQQRNAFNDLRLLRRWPAAAYSLIQWRKLVRYEAAALNAADASVAVSEADRNAMLRIAPDADITVISNGIDLDEYQPLPYGRSSDGAGSVSDPSPAHPLTPPLPYGRGSDRAGSVSDPSPAHPLTPPLPYGRSSDGAGSVSDPSPAHPLTLVFTGKMDYRPNIDAALWFAQEVLPLIAAQEPQAVLQLVGINPHARLDGLRRQSNIEITGAVDDTRPYIQNAAVYLIPMRVGGGTRFKALEAMACAKAVVSTPLGVEGIPVQDGQEMLLAETPAAFAAAVLRLLADQRTGGAISRSLGAAARRFVEERYGWETIIPQFDELYQRI